MPKDQPTRFAFPDSTGEVRALDTVEFSHRMQDNLEYGSPGEALQAWMNRGPHWYEQGHAQ